MKKLLIALALVAGAQAHASDKYEVDGFYAGYGSGQTLQLGYAINKSWAVEFRNIGDGEGNSYYTYNVGGRNQGETRSIDGKYGWNFQFENTGFTLTPYLSAGLGWTNYDEIAGDEAQTNLGDYQEYGMNYGAGVFITYAENFYVDLKAQANTNDLVDMQGGLSLGWKF